MRCALCWGVRKATSSNENELWVYHEPTNGDVRAFLLEVQSGMDPEVVARWDLEFFKAYCGAYGRNGECPPPRCHPMVEWADCADCGKVFMREGILTDRCSACQYIVDVQRWDDAYERGLSPRRNESGEQCCVDCLMPLTGSAVSARRCVSCAREYRNLWCRVNDHRRTFHIAKPTVRAKRITKKEAEPVIKSPHACLDCGADLYYHARKRCDSCVVAHRAKTLKQWRESNKEQTRLRRKERTERVKKNRLAALTEGKDGTMA